MTRAGSPVYATLDGALHPKCHNRLGEVETCGLVSLNHRHNVERKQRLQKFPASFKTYKGTSNHVSQKTVTQVPPPRYPTTTPAQS